MSDPASDDPRVALIGPLPPLRGGIAHHTACLCSALVEWTDLLTIPFQRLYPSRFFPGQRQEEPEDSYAFSLPKGEGLVQLDALDPRTWLPAADAVGNHASERVVIPWWTVALFPSLWVITTAIGRLNIPITFLCHNVVDHEESPWKIQAARAVLRRGSRHVVASKREAERLQDLLPQAEVVVHPHPVYRFLPQVDISLPRRANRELLFFGLIRRYKGLHILVEALTRISDADWHLTVAGEPWEDIRPIKERAHVAGIGSRIEWIERYVPASLASSLFGRADAVVLPYESATGCGVLALALGQGKPVVASDLSGLREQVLDGETGWLVPPGNAEELANTLLQVNESRSREMAPAVHRMASRYTWESLAHAVL